VLFISGAGWRSNFALETIFLVLVVSPAAGQKNASLIVEEILAMKFHIH
jgi:hypothetical protein